MATQQSVPEAAMAAAHAPEKPGRGTGRPVARRSWRAVLAWPFRAGDGIWLEPAGPVPGEVRSWRALGPLLAVAVSAFAVAQYAIGRPVAPEAWLAIAPLLASLTLRPLRTGCWRAGPSCSDSGWPLRPMARPDGWPRAWPCWRC